MKKLIFVFLVFAFGAQAQETEAPILGYRKDIQIDGKTYELYQTQKGDNVLIGKEEAKRNGIFLFKAAKKILTEEPTFSVALPMVNLGGTNLNSDKVFATDPSAKSRREALKSSHVLDQSNGGFAMIAGLSVRPSAYRHLQIAGMFDTSVNGMFFSAEHDFFVLPHNNTFSAFSAGYFYGRTKLSEVYRLKGGSSGEEIKVPFAEQGLTISYRIFVPEITENTKGSFVVSYRLGKNGTRQFFGGMQFGFGGGSK